MELSLSAAAKTTGKGKSTIHRAIKAGKLSARRTEEGSYMIDTSELARVFQLNVPAQPVGTTREDEEQPAEPQNTKVAVLQVRVEMLEQMLAREQDRVSELDRLLNEERTERRDLQRLVTFQAAQVKERPQTQATPEPQETPRKSMGMLQRLLGRLKTAG